MKRKPAFPFTPIEFSPTSIASVYESKSGAMNYARRTSGQRQVNLAVFHDGDIYWYVLPTCPNLHEYEEFEALLQALGWETIAVYDYLGDNITKELG